MDRGNVEPSRGMHDPFSWLYELLRDAARGTSLEAHRTGLERIVQGGGQPISWVSLACELQRDWARLETVPEIVDVVLTTRLLAGV